LREYIESLIRENEALQHEKAVLELQAKKRNQQRGGGGTI